MTSRINKGFTLVELLVAISIIATLTAILLPNFMSAREKAKDARKKSDLAAMKNALRLYYNDYQTYPLNKAAWETAIPNYAPQMTSVGIGYTYYYTQTTDGDGFQLCVDLDAALESEILESQGRCGPTVCGLPVSSVTENRYVICAN